MARNTDGRQVWPPPEDPGARRRDVYGYGDDLSDNSCDDAALAEAGDLIAARTRRDADRALRFFALAGAVVGLAGLTLAACVLSYSSMHHLATEAGVSLRLASVYPVIFDALLVVAGCAVLALRGAGLASRIYAWLSMLLLLGCLAAGGAIQAAAVRVPRHVAGVVAAIVPWALVLIGFGLLLTLLRYARVRRVAGPGHQADLEDRASAAVAGPAERCDPGIAAEPAGASGEPVAAAATENEPGATPQAPPAQAPGLNPAPTSGDEAGDLPALRRTRSSPTPPGE